jgi:hypothetical protein
LLTTGGSTLLITGGSTLLTTGCPLSAGAEADGFASSARLVSDHHPPDPGVMKIADFWW